MELSGLFSGAITIFRKRLGLLISLALVPALISFLLLGGSFAVIAAGVGQLRDFRSAAFQTIEMGLVALAVASFVSLLVQFKVYGLISTASYQVAQGQEPSLGSLLAHTKGLLPRLAGVIAIFVGLTLAVYALIAVLLFSLAATSYGSSDSRAVTALVGVTILVFLVLMPLIFFVQIKLLYLLQAASLEQITGVAAMKRSWQLTKGAFWRTFGYYLIASAAVAAVSYVVSMITQVLTMPMMLNQSTGTSDSLSTLFAAIPAMAISMVLQSVVQAFTIPFIQAYITCMFIDQVRRSEMPPGFPGGFGVAPGYGYPTGNYPPAPPQSYPPQVPWQQPAPPVPPTPGSEPSNLR
jgi:hypothetical protein